MVNKLKDAHKREDLAEIDKLMAEIQQVWNVASQNMYQQTGGQGAQGAAGGQASQDTTGGSQASGGSSQGDVTDVDYEEVK